MNPDTYPVEWVRRTTKNGETTEEPVTLQLGKLSAAVKKAFANWLKPRLLADAREWMEPNEYLTFRQELAADGNFWNAAPSLAVARALQDQDGALKLARLQFGDSVKGWSDAELWELLDTKDADESSDYRIAFGLLWDEAHPKVTTATRTARRPSNGGAVPAGTTGLSPN